ncbi:MAG TPA: hypothetical protein VFE65_34315 [Pseudonocardia sp.]|nr:hypothetical protein [Pseudonocardia sp.]
MPTALMPDHRTSAQVLAERVRLAIQAGVLTPWYELPLVELAARYNLRTSALALALHGLVADGLLSVHTTVAVVTPLSAAELISVQNLRARLVPVLLERACGRFTPDALDRLEEHLSTMDPDVVGLLDPSEWGPRIRQFLLQLLTPDATRTEQLFVRELFVSTARYQALGWRQITEGGRATGTGLAVRRSHIATAHTLLDTFRTGDPRSIREIATRSDATIRTVGEASLIPAHTVGRRRVAP